MTPLVLCYNFAPSLAAQHFPGAIVMAPGGFTPPGATFPTWANTPPIDELAANLAATHGTIGPLIAAGFSAGGTGVRAQIGHADALICVDGSYASDPAEPWQIDPWRDALAAASQPGGPILYMTGSHTSAGGMSPAEVIELAADLPPSTTPRTEVIENATLKTWPESGAKAHAFQGSHVLPEALADVAKRLGLDAGAAPAPTTQQDLRDEAEGNALAAQIVVGVLGVATIGAIAYHVTRDE